MRNDESMGAQIREAGRKVLHGTLSVILAASLVPATPITVYAEENQPVQQQGDGQQQGEGQQQQQQQQQQPQEQPPTEQQQQQGGEGQEQQQGDDQQQQQQQGEGQEQQQQQGEGQQQGDGQQQQQGEGQQQQQQGDGQQQQGQQQQQQNQSGDKKKEESKGSDDQKKDDSKKDDNQSKSNEDDKKLTVQADPAVTGVTATLASMGDAVTVGENTTYYYGSTGDNQNPLTITFTVTGQDFIQNAPTVTLKYKIDGGDEQSIQMTSSSASDNSITGSYTFAQEGTYTDISVAAVVTGDESGVQTSTVLPGPYKVINASKPSITAFNLSNSDGTSTTDVSNFGGTATSPLYVNLSNAQKIVVTTNYENLNTASNASYLVAYDKDGSQIGNPVAFSKSESGPYTATLDGVITNAKTGKVALRAELKSLGMTTSTTKLIGCGEDYKANGSLIIDNGNGPVIDSFGYSNASDYQESETVTHKVLRLGDTADSKVEIQVPVTDESFVASGVKFYASKDEGSESEVLPTGWTVDDSDPNKHIATLAFAEEGDYTVRVTAQDALGNNQIKTADPVENCTLTESFVVVKQPVVTSVTTATKTWDNKDLKSDATTSTAFFDKEPTFTVQFSGKHIDLTKTYVVGVPLSSIPENGGEVEGYTFSQLTQTNGIYSLTVTLPEDNYNFKSADPSNPMVKVSDWYIAGQTNGTPVPGGFFQPFAVDKTAPTVTFSMNAAYVNVDNLGVTPDKVLFFNKSKNDGGKETQLVYAIVDQTSPIAEVKTIAADGTEQVVYNKDFDIGTNPSTTFNGATTLQEQPFTNAVKLHVKDASGNKSVWSLDDATLYKDTDKQVEQPIELVEDHTAPKLTFAAAPKTYNYDTFNNKDVNVPLSIEERNIPYMQRFASTISPVTTITRDGANVTSQF